MDLQRWLMRARRWVQKPPSWGRVKLVVGVIAACVALAVVEQIWGWPDWLRVNRIKP